MLPPKMRCCVVVDPILLSRLARLAFRQKCFSLRYVFYDIHLPSGCVFPIGVAPELMVSAESFGVGGAFVAMHTRVWRADVRWFRSAHRRIVRIFSGLYCGQMSATPGTLFLRLPCGIIRFCWSFGLGRFLRCCDIDIFFVNLLFLDPPLLPGVWRTTGSGCVCMVMLPFHRHRILEIVYAHARTPLQNNLRRGFIE